MKWVHCKKVFELLYINWVIVLLLLALITTSLALTGNIVKKQQESKQISEAFDNKYGENQYYWMNEAFDDFAYYSYVEGDSDEEQYHKMTSLLNELWSEDRCSFYTCNNQMLEIQGTTDEIYLEGYENGDAEYSVYEIDGKTWSNVKTVLVSENFFSCNDIEIKSGRGFDENDYIYTENKNVPVILGSAYKDKYQVGDTFEARYIGNGFTAEVVGFMDNKSFYLSSAINDFVSLERYIILPAWKMEEKNEFSTYVTLAELCGNVQSKLGTAETRNIIETIFSKYNNNWNFSLRNPEENGEVAVVDKYGAMTKQVEKQFNIMVLIAVVFTLISLILNVYRILEKNKYTFGVELLCGAGLKDIYIEGYGFILVIIEVGNLWATLFLIACECGRNSILLVQGVVTAILIIMAICNYIFIKRMRIDNIIGGDE